MLGKIKQRPTQKPNLPKGGRETRKSATFVNGNYLRDA